MAGNKINLVCCDIPYSTAAVESKQGFKTLFKNKVIANDHLQTHEEYKKFNTEWLEAIIPYLASKNSAYIFNADKMLFSLRDALIGNRIQNFSVANMGKVATRNRAFGLCSTA